MTPRFHTYGWYRDAACTQPFYVGKGLRNRETHWRDMRRNKNTRLLTAVAEVLAEQGFVPTKILQNGLHQSRTLSHRLSHYR